MKRKCKFTRGPVDVNECECGDFDILAGGRGPCDGLIAGSPTRPDEDREEESWANASLIASAFNAATTCEDMGYDGEACVKAVPELVAKLDAIDTFGDVDWSGVAELIAKCRG